MESIAGEAPAIDPALAVVERFEALAEAALLSWCSATLADHAARAMSPDDVTVKVDAMERACALRTHAETLYTIARSAAFGLLDASTVAPNTWDDDATPVFIIVREVALLSPPAMLDEFRRVALAVGSRPTLDDGEALAVLAALRTSDRDGLELWSRRIGNCYAVHVEQARRRHDLAGSPAVDALGRRRRVAPADDPVWFGTELRTRSLELSEHPDRVDGAAVLWHAAGWMLAIDLARALGPADDLDLAALLPFPGSIRAALDADDTAAQIERVNLGDDPARREAAYRGTIGVGIDALRTKVAALLGHKAVHYKAAEYQRRQRLASKHREELKRRGAN